MNAIIKSLIFDKELVAKIRKAKPAKDVLYVDLMMGKITMKEYLAALDQ